MDTRPIRKIEIGVAALLAVSLLLEACGAAPASAAGDSRQDARMLLLAIHSLALGEEDAEDAGVGLRGAGVLLRPVVRPEAGPIDEVKAAIRDLEAECAQERVAIQDTLPEADMGEAVAALDEVCRAELARLQTVLADLRARRQRGSWFKRTIAGKVLAGVWKFTKQTVKRSAPTVLLAVISGGGGVVVKHVLIERGRADLRRELRTGFGRFLARKGVQPQLLELVHLSPGRWPPRKRSTGGQTTAGEAEVPVSTEDFSPTVAFELPADGLWTAVCGHRNPEDWTIDWTLSINLLARSFESRATWTRQVTESDGWLYSHQLDHDGLGSITEDGMLEGPFREVTTLVLSKGGVVSDPQVTEYEGGMYGVISADLKTMCISRGEDPGAYDIEYIRRIGREAFFEPDAGCEADCTISTGP